MVYKEYHYKHKSGITGTHEFNNSHFGFNGEFIPELEALRLINKWNQNSHGWVYWI